MVENDLMRESVSNLFKQFVQNAKSFSNKKTLSVALRMRNSSAVSFLELFSLVK